MRTKLILLLAAIAAAVHAHAAPAPILALDDELPDAATILDRHVEVTGGEQAYRKLKTRTRSGKLAVAMAGHEFEAKFETQARAPSKSRMMIDGAMISQVSVCDGKNAWEWRPNHSHGDDGSAAGGHQTELLEGAKKARAIEQAQFHPAVDWREAFPKVETVGLTHVNEQPAWEVKVTTKFDEYSRFYDKKSGRLVRTVRATKSDSMGALDVRADLSDYREIDGVWLPTKRVDTLVSANFGEGTQTWTYSKTEHNVEIPESLFELPAELREHAHPAHSKKKAGEHGGVRESVR